MCGRYNLITDADALMEFFELESSLLQTSDLAPRYNIAPSQEVAAVRMGEEGRELVMLRWGLVPFWARDTRTGYRMINARAETVASKPAYRAAFRERRCLIPATGFYEWKGTSGNKQPYFIGMRNEGLMAFAGVWEHWQTGEECLESCSIIVTQANERVRCVHERMPVILDPQVFDAWLDPANRDVAALQSLLQPYSGSELTVYPVNRAVNSPQNDDPRCMQQVENS